MTSATRQGQNGVQPGARGKGRPREGHAPDPDHLARIAFTAFAKAGYEGTSVRAIAAQADVDPALVTRRYGSKAGLWKASVDRLAVHMQTMWAALDALRNAPAPFPQRYRGMLRHFVEFCHEVPELARFFTGEIETPGERRDYLLDTIWKPHVAAMQPFLEEARESDMATSEDTPLMLLLIVGMAAIPTMMASVIQEETVNAGISMQERLSQAVETLLIGRGA